MLIWADMHLSLRARTSIRIAGLDPKDETALKRAYVHALKGSGFAVSRRMAPLIFLSSAWLVVAACTSGSSTGSGPVAQSSPTIAPADLQGKILFTRAGGKYGDETIYTANADGTKEQRITDFGATCCPRWTTDGTHILIAELAPDHKRITTGIINPNGSLDHKVPLPQGTLNLGPGTWFPDGTRIAFDGWDDANHERDGIYTARAADGGDLVRVTRSRTSPVDVSTDGEIFFFRPVEGFPSIGDQPEGSLFVVNDDGSGARRVTPADLPVVNIGGGIGRLSADGSKIVFTSDGAIWTIGSDGSAAKKIFDDPDGSLAITPTWSPDGTMILFGLDPPGSLATLDFAPPNGLYVIRADGTELTPVVTTDDFKREPDWIAG